MPLSDYGFTSPPPIRPRWSRHDEIIEEKAEQCKPKPRLDNSNKYILCVEAHKCDKAMNNYCIYKKTDGCNTLSCPYPMRENPLCLCDNFDNCNRLYKIVKHKGKKYIFYQCDRCEYFIKDYKGAVKSILKPLNSRYIYYDNDLKKLIKEAIKIEKTDDTDKIVKFFENAFEVMNCRM